VRSVGRMRRSFKYFAGTNCRDNAVLYPPATYIPSNMVAVEITSPGPAKVLELVPRAVPQAGPGEVLVRVAAAGVNRPDVIQRLGLYPAPKGVTDIPGLEVAGKIVAVGEGVNQAVLNSDVCALVPGGGYAQYCTVPAELCLPVPAGMSMTEAAAVPETHWTVYFNLFMRGELASGQRLLVHGGCSGIGSTAIQMAAARGVEVFATAGSALKVAQCEALGAVKGINYNEQDFATVCKEVGGVDMVLDMVGGEYLEKNLKCLRDKGTLCVIGFLGKSGPKSNINLTRLMLKQLKITGSTLRSQPLSVKKSIAHELRSHVWPMLEAGQIKPLLDESNVLPLEQAAEAHERMESGSLVGKLVLIPPS